LVGSNIVHQTFWYIFYSAKNQLSLHEKQIRAVGRGAIKNPLQDQIGNKSYLDEGIRIPEPANKAYFLYQKAEVREKRKLLNYLLSNFQVVDGTLYPTYKSPLTLLPKDFGID
jgi:hypothetical protein